MRLSKALNSALKSSQLGSQKLMEPLEDDDDPLRSLIRNVGLRCLRWRGRGGQWTSDDAVATIHVRESPKKATAATASCVSANDILECLTALRRSSRIVENTLGKSRTRLEFVSKAEAVALAQRAVDRGFLERVGRGTTVTTAQLRRSLLDDFDPVAARRRRVFRIGSHRFWRFALPELYKTDKQDIVSVTIGHVKLPSDAFLPALGYVSACVRIDLVVVPYDHSDGQGYFPRQRHRTTMIRRAQSDFDLNETVDFALPVTLRDAAFFVIEVFNEGAHGVLHAKSLGATRIAFKDVAGSDGISRLRLDRSSPATEKIQCACVSSSPRAAPTDQYEAATVDINVLVRSVVAPRRFLQITTENDDVLKAAEVPTAVKEIRIRCVVVEARHVTYDLAETHGLRWMLRARLALVDAVADTPWALKYFHCPQFFSNNQRIRGGGARFAFSSQTDGVPTTTGHPLRRRLFSTPGDSQKPSRRRRIHSTPSSRRYQSVDATLSETKQTPRFGERIALLTNNVRTALMQTRQALAGTLPVEHHTPIDDDDDDEGTLVDDDDDIVFAYSEQDSDDEEVPQDDVFSVHSGAFFEHKDDDDSSVLQRRHRKSRQRTTSTASSSVYPQSEVVVDMEKQYFPKLKVEAAANPTTEAVRVVMMQKSIGGLPRRIGAAVIPLKELPRSPPPPSWHVLTTVGPRGVLTRNGEIKASIWIDDPKAVPNVESTTPVAKRRSVLSFVVQWGRVTALECWHWFLLRMTSADHKHVLVLDSQRKKWRQIFFFPPTTKKETWYWYCLATVIILSYWIVRFVLKLILAGILYTSRMVGTMLIALTLILTGMLLNVVGPIFLAKIATFCIEKYGVQGVCRCECESVRLSIFVTRATAEELPPLGLTLKKHQREMKQNKVPANHAPPKHRHWRLVLSLDVRGFKFFNPAASRYPHETMASVKQVVLTVSMACKHVPETLRRAWHSPWRPNPRKCVAAFGLERRKTQSVLVPVSSSSTDDDSTKEEGPRQRKTSGDNETVRIMEAADTSPPPQCRYAGVVVVESCFIMAPQVNMEMDAASELNVVALTRDLADARVAKFIPRHQYAPNALRIDVLAARRLPYLQKPPERRPHVGSGGTVGLCSDFLTTTTEETSPGEHPPLVATASTKPGHVLMIRCRVRDEKQRDSHLSNPVYAEDETLHATWTESRIDFRDRYDDASAVLALEVFAVERASAKKSFSVGRWLTTLEALANRPEERLVHTSDNFVCSRAPEDAESSAFVVEGWFPLRDADLEYADPRNKSYDGLGAIRLRVTWYHEPGKGKRSGRRAAPLSQAEGYLNNFVQPKSALDQLTENARESGLRLGSPRYTERMLDTFPLLIDVRALLLHDVNARLHDILWGKSGQAMVGSGEHTRVAIPKIVLDAEDFYTKHPCYGAMTIAGFLRDFVLRGCVPELLSRQLLYQFITLIGVD